MAYDLSFTAEFFCDGDPYEVEAAKNNRPTNVLQALFTWAQDDFEEWAECVEDVLGMSLGEIERLNIEDYPDQQLNLCHDLMKKIEETNTCSNLDSPVAVWIDKEGFYTVDVYEKED